MAGELELDNYFLWTEPFKGSGDFSLQALYIMFLIFVTIIIANLMIAMTVNQTDDLVRKALVIRLKENVYMISVCYMVWNYLKTLVGTEKSRKLFQYLYTSSISFVEKKYHPSTNDIKGVHFVDAFLQKKSWKVCILPHSLDQLKINSKGRKYLKTFDTIASSFDKGYNVYIYDDNAGCSKDKLDITVPAWVVEKTLVMLANQKIEKDKINAQEVERDIMMMKEGSIDFTFRGIF